jgi:hypothetical protein
MAETQDDAPVTIGEEIRSLLAAGWTWDGDKLVHPGSGDIWIIYKRADTSGFGARIDQFESELKRAVLEARRREMAGESGSQ